MSWSTDFGPDRQTEAQRLGGGTEGPKLELALERILQTLSHAESHLTSELYSCTVPLGLRSEGEACLVWFDPLNRRGDQHTNSRQSDSPPAVAEGPTSLLCGLPTCGAYPWVCAKHWLGLRSISQFRTRRLKKEYRRSLKK